MTQKLPPLALLSIALLIVSCADDTTGSDPTDNNGSWVNNGANNGSNNGANNGSNNGANNGSNNGANNGSNNGANNGSNNGVNNGSNNGANNGANNGVNNGGPPNPLDFATDVSVTEIQATLEDLEAFGTRYTGTQGERDSRAYLVDRLEAYGIETELDPFNLGETETANIIGRKLGTEEPNVVWIISAHYDSTSDRPQVSAPGVDDNASGVSAVLETARLLAPHDFKYSIWFVFTAAEEQGSRGSDYMVKWLDRSGLDVRGVMAPDMIGYWPLQDDDYMDILGDGESEHLVEEMAQVAEALGVQHKTYIQHGYCYGDDHTNFQEWGIPAIAPMDCVEAHNIPSSGETTPHYHRDSDTLDTIYLPFTRDVVGVHVATVASWAVPLR